MNLVFDKAFLEKIALSFARAFLAVFIAGVTGLLMVPDWNAAKSAAIALIVAAVTAGLRAVQHVVFDGPVPPVSSG